MLKRTLVPCICLFLILFSFALAAPPTNVFNPVKVISSQTGPIAQFQGQMVDLGGGNAAIAYFCNRDTNQGLSLLSYAAAATDSYDIFVRIVDKYGQIKINDVKVTSGTVKPVAADMLDPLTNSLKSNSFNLISDGQGGVILSYTVTDAAKNTKILMVHKLNSTGSQVWLDKNGVAGILIPASNFSNPRIVSDGAGGCFVSWLVTLPDPMGGATKYYGQIIRVETGGSTSIAPVDIPSNANTNILNDFEIAAAPTSLVFAAWSENDALNSKAEVRGAMLDVNLTYKWGDPAVAPVLLLSQDSNFFRDITLAGDANATYAAANYYDSNSTLFGINIQKTDFVGQTSWNNVNETWGQSIALVSATYTTIADCPALLVDGSGGVHAAYWDFDGDTSFNQLKMGGINSDKSAKTIVNLQKVAGYAGGAKLVADTDGGVAAFWMDGRGVGASGSRAFDIYAQRVKNGAAVFPANGLNLTVDTGYKLLPSALYLDDRYFMIYSKSIDSIYLSPNVYGIYYNQISLDGTFITNSEKSSPLIDDLGPVANSLPHGVRLSGSRTFIAWNDARNGVPQIYANILDKSGNKTRADISFLSSTLDFGVWPVTALTPDGKYVWVVWSGLPFDPNLVKALSPGMLSPRSLNALQAQMRARNVQAKAESIKPRFYAQKFDSTTGNAVFTEPFRIGSGYFGLEALPAIAATDTGGLALAYGSIGNIAQVIVRSVGSKISVSPRSQPSFGILPRAGLSAKAPVQNYSVYLKVVNSDGSFIAGQSANSVGMLVSDPSSGYSQWTDLAPSLVNSGDGYLVAAWMRQATKIKGAAGQAATEPYLIFGQRIKLADYSLYNNSGIQLTQATANLPATNKEFHANPYLTYRNGKIGLTWCNMIIDTDLAYTKTRIDALAGTLDANGFQLLFGPIQVSDQKTAYYDSRINADWNLYLYSNMKFLNDRLESVVSWQDYNQVAPAGVVMQGVVGQDVKAKIGGGAPAASPTIKTGSVYAMHLGSDGSKKLSAPFQVISASDKAVALPTMIDSNNNCSLAFAASSFNIGGTGASELNFVALMQRVLNVVFGNSTIVNLQNVGFILPATPTNFTMAPASDATSLLALANYPADFNGSDIYVYDLAGNLVAVLGVSGSQLNGVISSLQPNTIYQFKLAAVNDAGSSAYTDVYQACTQAESVTGLLMNSNVLSWNAATVNPTLTRYQVARRTASVSEPWEIISGATFNTALATNSFVDATMNANLTYNYRVIPYNQLGNIPAEGSMITASLTKSAPAIEKIKISLSGQQGLTVRSGMYVGDDLLVRIIENNPGGRITQVQVKFTEQGGAGRSYTWTGAAGLMAATTDSYVTIPVNIPKGTYNMAITTLNDSGLTATKSVIIRKDDVARVVDGFITALHLPGGTGLQASQAGTSDFATISYQLSKDPSAPVTLRIVDTGGQVLMSRVIARGVEGAHVGYNMINWDGLTLDGGKISRGLKMIQIVVDGKLTTGAIAVLH